MYTKNKIYTVQCTLCSPLSTQFGRHWELTHYSTGVSSADSSANMIADNEREFTVDAGQRRSHWHFSHWKLHSILSSFPLVCTVHSGHKTKAKERDRIVLSLFSGKICNSRDMQAWKRGLRWPQFLFEANSANLVFLEVWNQNLFREAAPS